MEALVTLSIHPIAPIPLYGSRGHTEGVPRGVAGGGIRGDIQGMDPLM